jgi:hypothetical protein
MHFGDRTERRKFADAGIGKENIYPPLLCFDSLKQKVEVGQIRNVTADGNDICAYCRNGCIKLLLSPPSNKYKSALGSEQLCGRKPNAAAAARYERDLLP